MLVSPTHEDHISDLDNSLDLTTSHVLTHAQLSIIFQRNWERLYRLAYHLLKDNDDAQDVVQEVFINIWDRRHELQIHANIDHYLFGAVRYKTLTRLQTKLSYNKRNIPLENALVDSFAEAVDPILVQELQEEIDRQVKLLPEKMRQVFYLRTVECLSIPQIAEKLLISEATVKNHLAAARRKLRTQLGDAAYLAAAVFLNQL
ncbi:MULTISPECIES: RNA polymerase sigma factor [Sphingobacterium]|uniref:RNA polymerase sigma factor n=1 Tax=Sphingobacterium populi TaxID=1812824 RepID=A0ABW5UG43_9SPHI|nr:sigma-70 family RNA polymerase sigma factor [Sphingobacterium sp. CFCC 11742]